MADKNYTINLDPIFKVLERLVCEPGESTITADDLSEMVDVLRVVGEVSQVAPHAAIGFYNQIGLNVMAYLMRRVVSEKISADLINSLKQH